MSNLLKSKFLLGVMLVAVMFVGAVALSATPAAADCTITSTLRVGSVGVEVQCLQGIVGATADGKFGPLTKAAVMAWQAGHGLVADGVVGPLTRAALMGSPTGNFPAGCTSASGYSSTTGLPCNTGTSAGLPAGCSTTSGYSPLTGARCDSGSSLPAGCSSTAGYSPTTGAKCDGSTGGGSSTGALEGGAGDAVINETSTDVESTVNEGSTENIHGFRVEADGSDIEVTSVKVSFVADGAGTSSLRLSHYADEVSILMDGEEVGSADVDDFSKDGNVYSKTIQLSDAIVREGNSNRETFHVAVSALSNMDSADFDATWTITVSNIRFNDATGAILTDNYSQTSDFGFTSLAASGDVKVTVSKDTSSPVAQNVEVSDTSTTKDVLMLAFKIKATGSDISFDTLNITTALSAVDDSTRANIIDELQLRRGSTELATIDGSVLDGTETFTLDDTYTIEAGDTEIFKIYATVKDVDLFDSGDAVSVSFASFSPEDENGDIIADTGSAAGELQTFVVDVPTFSLVGTPTLALYQHTDGTGAGEEDLYKGTIVMDVMAPEDQAIYLPLDSFAFGTAGAAGVEYTIGGTITSAALVYTGSDTLTENAVTNTIRIEAGDTQRFTLTVYVTGDDTQSRLQITSVWYEISDTAPNNGPEVTTGWTNFKTPLVLLAK